MRLPRPFRLILPPTLSLATLISLGGCTAAASVGDAAESLWEQITASGFPITYDARGLYQAELIVGPAMLDTTALQTVNVAPGTYTLNVMYGQNASVSYTVTPNGTIDYDPSFEGILSGRGSTKLVISGRHVTVDASGLSQDGLVLCAYAGPTFNTRKPMDLVLLPAQGYRFLVGPDRLSTLVFDVDLAGKVHLDPKFAVTATGDQTSTLKITGATVQVSVPTTGTQVLVDGTEGDGVWLSTAQTNTVSLLPLSADAGEYDFYIGPGEQSTFRFNLDESGRFFYDATFDGYASGRGTAALTMTPPTIGIDSISSGSGTFVIGALTGAGLYPRPSFQSLSLLPSVAGYPYWDPSLAFNFFVKEDGTLDFPTSLDVNVTGRGGHTLEVWSNAGGGAPIGLTVPANTILANSGTNTLEPRGSSSLSVSDVGDAHYHVPIWVAPGRAGIQPDLALDYSSRGGNGLEGVGWQLSGLPRITRCRNQPKRGFTSPPVAFDATDSFCLDGERLVAMDTGRTQFHTFRDRYSLITAHDPDAYGPTWFEERKKDGRIFVYGRGSGLIGGERTTYFADSLTHLPTQQTSTVRYAWAVSELSDRAGNSLAVSYVGSTGGDLLPSEIDYTFSAVSSTTGFPPFAAKRSVKFVYDTSRSDVDDYFVSGLPFSRPDRLVRLEMYGPDPLDRGLLRTFNLAYTMSLTTKRSLLSAVSECDGLPTPGTAGGASPLCRNLDLGYTVGSPLVDVHDTGITDVRTPDSKVPSATSGVIDPTLTILDVNGDGMDDLLYRTKSNMTYHLRLSTGTGLGPDQDTGIPVGHDLPPYTTGPHPLDFDGDGHTDLLVSTGTPAAPRNAIYLATATGNGWTLGPAPWLPAVTAGYRQVEAADLNGDRFPDLIMSNLDPTRTFGAVAYAINEKGTFNSLSLGAEFDLMGTTHYYADVDGDGRTDLLTPDSQTPATCPSASATDALLAFDVDADPTKAPSWRLTTLPSWGCTMGLLVGPGGFVLPTRSDSTNVPIFGDFDGDGLVDVIDEQMTLSQAGDYTSAQQLNFDVNTGRGFARVGAPILQNAAPTWTSDPPPPWTSSLAYRVMDWDENGHADLLERSVQIDLPIAGYRWRHTAAPQTTASAAPMAFTGVLPIATANAQQDPATAANELQMFEVLDVNGDGLDDVVMVNGGRIILYVRHGSKPDLLNATSGSFGTRSNVAYKPIGPGASSDTCKAPLHCVNGRTWVVDNVSVDNGIGGMNVFTHQFADGEIDMVQGSFIGFKTHSIVDAQTGTRTTLTFDLSPNTSGPTTFYPLAGHATDESTSTILAGKTNTTVRVTTLHNDYDVQGAGPYTVEPTVTTAQVYEGIPGQTFGSISTQIVRQSFDAYGNLQLRTTLSPNEGVSTTESITYANRPDSWLVSLPRLKTTTSAVTKGSVVESSTRQTGYDFDSNGLLIRQTDDPGTDDGTFFEPLPTQADGVQTLYTEYQRDPTSGLVVATVAKDRIDGSGLTRTTTCFYDALEGMFPEYTVDPLGHGVQRAYDRGLGVLAERVDENGLTTFYQYDTFGRIRAEHPTTGDDRTVTYTGPSAASPFGTMEDARTGAPDVVSQLDSLGRTTLTATTYRADGKVVDVATTYDARGNVQAQSRPFFAGASPARTVTTYDALRRVTSVAYPDGSSETRGYAGNTTTVTDAEGNVRSVISDDLGRPVTSVQTVASGHNTSVQLGYGPFDALETVTDPAGNVARTLFDRHLRPLVAIDPDSGPRKFSYDVFGERTHDVRGGTWNGTAVLGGADTSSQYDAEGRVFSVMAPDVTQTQTWDTASHGVHKLASSSLSSGSSITYSYDSAARLASKTWSNGASIGFGFDAMNRPSSVTYPQVGTTSLVTQNAYSGRGQLVGVQNAATGSSYWSLVASDASEQFPQETFGNGVTSTWTEDPGHPGWLRTISTTGKQPVQSLTYKWDGHARLRGRSDAVNRTSETFDYDGVDRLHHWTWTGVSESTAVRYDNDDLGNLQARVVESGAGISTAYAYDATHFGPHQPSSTASGAFAYDGHGNQTAAPGRTATFNGLDLLASLTTGAGTYRFTYDGELRRATRVDPNGSAISSFGGIYEQRVLAGTKHHVFTVIAKQPIAQIEIVEANGSTSAPLTTYLHVDHQGSVDAMTDASGVPTAVKYEPFGMRVQAVDPSQIVTAAPGGVRTGFTGHEHDDDLGIVDMVGRVYDPLQHRFLSEDKSPPNVKNSQALNPYAYVFNNPLNWTDPTGFDGEPVYTDPQGPVYNDPGLDGNADSVTYSDVNYYLADPTSDNQSMAATQGSDGQAGPYSADSTAASSASSTASQDAVMSLANATVTYPSDDAYQSLDVGLHAPSPDMRDARIDWGVLSLGTPFGPVSLELAKEGTVLLGIPTAMSSDSIATAVADDKNAALAVSERLSKLTSRVGFSVMYGTLLKPDGSEASGAEVVSFLTASSWALGGGAVVGVNFVNSASPNTGFERGLTTPALGLNVSYGIPLFNINDLDVDVGFAERHRSMAFPDPSGP